MPVRPKKRSDLVGQLVSETPDCVLRNASLPGVSPQRKLEMVPLKFLRPAARNARTHSKKQIELIAQSIRRFGWINPIIVDQGGRIVAGHARADAAKLLGLKDVPVIKVTDLSELEIRAYTIADNKLALKSGWDRKILALELGELELALPEVDINLEITGFEPGEVDSIMSDFTDPANNHGIDEIPDLPTNPISKLGDLFVLGAHRILCGDARLQESYDSLMGSEVATMCFLDPPYNVKIDGHAGGRGRVKHREFAFASGEMNSAQFVEFLLATIGPAALRLVDGGIAFICMDWRHAGELLKAGSQIFDELKNVCVWAKTNAGQGSFYRNQHELVFVYKRGKAPHINTFGLGQHGRSRSNVWTYAGVNSFRAGRMDELKMHPTVKPVALIVDTMKDCSKRGSIILDCFSGSGSSILAADQIDRRAFCIEIDPHYVDISIERWQRYTGKDAVLESTGQTFDELAKARRAIPRR